MLEDEVLRLQLQRYHRDAERFIRGWNDTQMKNFVPNIAKYMPTRFSRKFPAKWSEQIVIAIKLGDSVRRLKYET